MRSRRSSNTNLQLYLTTCGLILFLFIIVFLLSDPRERDVTPTKYVYYSSIKKTENDQYQYHLIGNESKSDKYQLNLEHCKIFKVPLKSESLTRTRRVWKDHSSCDNGFSHIDDQGNLILRDLNKGCCYQGITRPESMIEDEYHISARCHPIKTLSSRINNEFFRIKCHPSGMDKSQVLEYHATVQFTTRIKNKIKYWDRNFPTESDRPPSVLMLAIDATSRTNFYRSLPKTVEQLKKLHFTDFRGHHIQGEPTFPNAIPILLGESAERFWKVNKTEWHSRWDSYPFIWKEFDKLGYITLFMEDEQKYGTFNYGGQTGFRYQPTDVYPRPLLRAREESRSKKGDMMQCFGNQSMPNYLLRYLNQFLDKTQVIPSFSLSWLTWPQHDFMEILNELDAPLSTFFASLSNNLNVLENTVIILFSDHGSWNALYSETPEGRLERRLPFLFIRYPKNHQKTIVGRQHLKNLMKNQNRLTTHYDTHQTLLQLVNMAATQTNKSLISTVGKGSSLLEKMPRSRTCKSANIDTFLCACDLMLPPTIHGQHKPDDYANSLKLPSPSRNAHPLRT